MRIDFSTILARDMDIAEFSLRQLIFEIRYDDAYILWDRAGDIHRRIARLWPGSQLVEGTPNQQSLQSDVASIVTGFKTAHIAARKPTSILQFSDQFSETLAIWVDALELTRFTRVGTRVVYRKSFPSVETANQAMVGLGLIRVPQSPIFNHKSGLYAADLRLVWQDEASQTQVVLRAERQEMEVKGLFDDSGMNEKKTADSVVVDLDRATIGIVELTKFRMADWLKGIQHLMSRDLNRVLNGQ
jgi:hypothetical protein